MVRSLWLTREGREVEVIGMAEYSVLCEYVEEQMDKIQAGKEVVVEVHDLATFERKVVRALISQEAFPESNPLLIEDYGGNLRERPWAIKVIAELDADEVESIPLRARWKAS